MAAMSSAEVEFTAKYPNTRVVVTKHRVGAKRFQVFAGNYLCAESYTSRQLAFRMALEYEENGLITPDPNELATL
jgi:hypothetical protein